MLEKVLARVFSNTVFLLEKTVVFLAREFKDLKGRVTF
ncbi:hypothetical protein CTO_0997 [Chlamydia trachomatis A2497]|uniref:Uncharacterized protein n=1 Tax=Chlamydia trachomatis serovar A (strain A2497) TaxID=580047 RepID=G4NN43_CHLT4|nr:hypothetical protein CTO_0997 [Chlamydia trachomatis A2497]